MSYDPTTWNAGDVITAEKLNKMEQGIKNEQVGPQGPQGEKGEKGDTGPAGPSFTLEAATTAKLGGVKQMAAIADIGAEPTQSDFNNLLAALRTAGMLANS